MSQNDPGLRTTPKAPRLLLVDDSAEGRRSLARLLQLHGFDVTEVGNGTAAIREIRASPPPQIVLTDLMLPDVDGLEVARAALATQPRPFVGLITGWAVALEDPELQGLDVDQVFLKPINTRSLVDAIRQALGSGP